MRTILEVTQQDEGEVTVRHDSKETVTEHLSRHILAELLNGNSTPFDTLYSVTVNILAMWPDGSLYEKYIEGIRVNVTECRNMHREKLEKTFGKKGNTDFKNNNSRDAENNVQ